LNRFDVFLMEQFDCRVLEKKKNIHKYLVPIYTILYLGRNQPINTVKCLFSQLKNLFQLTQSQSHLKKRLLM